MSENPLRDAIAEAIRDNDTILFMKGTPEAPACGFSAMKLPKPIRRPVRTPKICL